MQVEAALAREAELKEAIAAIHEQMALYDLSVEDLGISSSKPAKTKSAKSIVAAKYRDPISGKTWSVRDRAPLWIKGDAAQYVIG